MNDTTTPTPADVLRFDRFELQLHERRLLRDGQQVSIRPRAFDVLAVLARPPGRLVGRAALLAEAWPGLVVEDSNLASQIAEVRRALDSELVATVPGHGYRLAITAPPSPSPATATATATVPAAALFGRDEDLLRLRTALARPGCVTLTGPGGVGKTALARAVAAVDGNAWWCDLAALDDGAQVLPALARLLGRTPEPGKRAVAVLAQALTPGALLVLDNAEHVLDAVAGAVQPLCLGAPGLRVLVTSQAPLAIAGERVLRLAPLQQPEAAVALLVERVQAAGVLLPAPAEAEPLLRALCTSLDGLPLALEMAAARVPLLGLQGVLDGLAERFALLRQRQRDVPARQRTLQAALQWSHTLLPPAEQRLFRTLGVFRGGFTLELAVAVSGSDAAARWDVVEQLAVLADRSLVTVGAGDPPRYGLLETMRHYALAQLADNGDEQAVRQRHAHAVEDLFRAASDAGRGAHEAVPRARALAEMENAREAIAWALRHDRPQAARLSAYVALLASPTVWRADAYAWLAACEGFIDQLDAPGTQALWWRSFAECARLFSHPRAIDHARRAVAVCRAAGEELQLAFALATLAWVQTHPGPELQAALREAQALLGAHPEWPDEPVGLFLSVQAFAARLDGRPLDGLPWLEQALAMARAHGSRWGVDATTRNIAIALREGGCPAEALARLAAVDAGADPMIQNVCRMEELRALCLLGHFDAALARLPAMLELALRHSDPSALGLAARTTAQAGRLRAAARLAGLARQTLARHGVAAGSAAWQELAQAETLVQAGLPDAQAKRLAREGAVLDPAQAGALIADAP